MERSQFISLVSGEQERLRRFLLALCLGNKAEADDIAQETFLKAYLSSVGYQDKGRFAAWLYRIAHNTFLDHRKADRPSETIDERLQVADDNAASDDTFKYQELYAALAAIPPHERTAILLFYMQGYSAKEIAVITESTTDAVKMRLSRGREHLKDKLNDGQPRR